MSRSFFQFRHLITDSGHPAEWSGWRYITAAENGRFGLSIYLHKLALTTASAIVAQIPSGAVYELRTVLESAQ
jgi:hypothetical protein